jgi:hypothetical protein
MAELTKIRNKLDDIECKLRPVRTRLIVVWRSIEHSRYGVVSLDTEAYTRLKIEFGELRSALGYLEGEHLANERSYYNMTTLQWSRALKPPAKVTLKQLWQLWRNVEAARQAVAELSARSERDYSSTTDKDLVDAAARDLADVPVRERIDAETARDRAEATYNCASRVYEGRERWDFVKHCNDGWRMRAPKRPLPTGPNKPRAFTRSSYVRA